MLWRLCWRAIGAAALLSLTPLMARGASPTPLLAMHLQTKTVQGVTVYELSATNTYSSAATEIIVAARYLLPPSYQCRPENRTADGHCKVTFAVHRAMAPGQRGTFAHPLPASWVVPAGGTVPTDGFSAHAGQSVPEAICVAVIYEDGAMAGDPAIFRMLLLERQNDFQDAVWTANLLNQAAAATNTDFGALAGKLEARFAAHRQAWQLRFKTWHGVLPPSIATGGRVCRSLAGELRRGAGANLNAEQASRWLALALSHARAWVSLFAQSRPALQASSSLQ